MERMNVVCSSLSGCSCAVEWLVEELCRRYVALNFCAYVVRQSVFPLSEQVDACVTRVEHVVDVRPFEGGEDVVFVRRDKFVRGRHYVVVERQRQLASRKFVRQIFLWFEGVGKFRTKDDGLNIWEFTEVNFQDGTIGCL